jgi:hypothetical protein
VKLCGMQLLLLASWQQTRALLKLTLPATRSYCGEPTTLGYTQRRGSPRPPAIKPFWIVYQVKASFPLTIVIWQRGAIGITGSSCTIAAQA